MKRSTAWFLVVLAALCSAAAWYGWQRGQRPYVSTEEACKRQCRPLSWQIKSERKIPNAPEDWRNYPINPRCICG